MVNNNPSLRLIVILSLLYSGYSQAAIADNDAMPIISPFDVTKFNHVESLNNTEVTSPVHPFDSIENALSPSTANNSSSMLQPTLVGIFVNGQEQGNFDALYDPSIDMEEATNLNDHYYLSVDDIEQLTAVTFTKSKVTQNVTNDNVASNNFASKNVYDVQTPIGNTKLSAAQIVTYANPSLANNDVTDYLLLSTLKNLGIAAEYHPQDLAIKLNMGWRPDSVRQNLTTTPKKSPPPIDYYPKKSGLLGLSFDSALSVTKNSPSRYYNDMNDNTVNRGNDSDESIVNRQTSANIGAFGYVAGGIWGVKGVGSDSENSRYSENRENSKRRTDKDSVRDYGIDSLTTLPWDWQDWRVDNLYWVKSEENYATRIGTNRPNALGRGARIGGSDFTGAMVAYSNRNVARHLATFDDDSDSLLENTSEDYQHLTGTAAPGGVAELRINSRAIARVQIGLDGRYEFLNLDVNRLDLTNTFVEIAIYEYPTASQPLEVRPMFLGKRRTNVATDEVLIEAGLGRSGNLLDSDNPYDDNSQLAAHIYTEYGVNNRLAVRGGVNTLPTPDENTDIAWHAGMNLTPTLASNADISYAHSPTQDLWQVELNYQHKKLWLDYRYRAHQYQANQYLIKDSLRRDTDLFDQRHQLLLNYRPSDKTTININQYYNDLDNKLGSHASQARAHQQDYSVYVSMNRRFNESLNGGIYWDSRDDRYGYRLLWQDTPNLLADSVTGNTIQNSSYQRSSLGLSGDNVSETLSLRHVLNNKLSLGQSVSHLHGASNLLYQGDVSYRFDNNGLSGLNELNGERYSALSNHVNVGYSLYDNHFGWQADWQLTHRNGLSFGLGYQHRYVNGIPNKSINEVIVDSATNDILLNQKWSDTPWGNENYLYARLSFDMFKAPKQPLRLGRVMPQRSGSIVINLTHPPEPAIEVQSIGFSLNGQKVEASLLNTQTTQSQYSMNNIRAGDYLLEMDAKNLPIEFSISELVSPYIRVSNYTPTYVPIELQKTYGVSGRLADDKQGVDIGIYAQDKLVRTVKSGSYGYFQAFGLPSRDYVLTAEGYESIPLTIRDDFVLQVELSPSSNK